MIHVRMAANTFALCAGFLWPYAVGAQMGKGCTDSLSVTSARSPRQVTFHSARKLQGPYSPWLRVGVIAGGGFLVESGVSEARALLQYDSVGRLVRETLPVADPGAGILGFFPLDADSFFVTTHRGAYVVDSDGRRLRRWRAVGPIGTVFRLPNGKLLQVAAARTEQSFGYPFHITSAWGDSILYSFGRSRAEALTPPEPNRYAAARGLSGTFWTADRERFTITQWDTTGTCIKVFRIPHAGAQGAGDAFINSIYVHSDGKLWITTARQVRKGAWDQKEKDAMHSDVPETPGQFDSLYRTRVYVVDAQRGIIVGQGETNGLLAHIPASPLLARFVQDSGGKVTGITVVTTRMRHP